MKRSLLLSVLILFGSTANAACYDRLRDSDDILELLVAAIDQVNALLPETAKPLALLNKTPQIRDSADVIPVSSVRSSRTQGMVAQVPPGCREIVIGGSEFFDAYQSAVLEESLLVGDEVHMLSLLLLHEMGHIDAGHHGAFLPVVNQDSVLNIDHNLSKEYEREADAFVSTVLGRHAALAQTGEADFGALWLIVFLGKLSFDISGRASIDCFGCRPLGSPDIFWDHSQSHENLEYRVLTINHAISPSDTSHQLLSAFETERQIQ